MKEEIEVRSARHCPWCGAPLFETEATSITWNDKKKEFLVTLSLGCVCGSLPPVAAQEKVSVIPHVIAEKSTCSCGSVLDLSDYSLEQTGGRIQIQAVYICKACGITTPTTTKPRVLSRFFSSLKQLWRRTTAIEVGLTGVRFEKEATGDEDAK